MNIRSELAAFFRGFKYAAAGLINCIKNERNMRFHFCAAFYVLIFMRFYDLSPSDKAVVYITIASVISLEAINTAVEALTDLVSPEKNELAKIAKDCAAGAVLAAAIASLAVAYCLFFDIKVFSEIGSYFSENISMLILLILSFIIWFFIIFLPSGSKKGKTK